MDFSTLVLIGIVLAVVCLPLAEFLIEIIVRFIFGRK